MLNTNPWSATQRKPTSRRKVHWAIVLALRNVGQRGPVPMRQDRRQDKGTVVTLAFQEKPLQTLAACGLPPNGLIRIQWRKSGLSGRISWDCQNI